jgi:hypothetical protein
MNLDFSADPMFSWYVVALAVSGVLVIGAAVLPRQSIGERIIYAILGVAMLGYGIYLGFIFTGSEYQIFFYVFVVPILVLARVGKTLFSGGTQRA